ncbi:MAG: hypothetical protein AAYR33_06045 [Acetobacteraceae bacterium]
MIRNHIGGKKNENIEWTDMQEGRDVSKIDQCDLPPRSCYRHVHDGAHTYIGAFTSVHSATGKNAGDSASRKEVPYRD